MEVQSIDINGGLQDIFSIGNTPSMCLDLVLRNTTDTIFTTNQVKVEIGLKYDSTIEYIPLGIFNIADVKKDDFTTKFTCYDNMFKFDTAYFSKLGDTPTLSQVVNELASITGVQFIGSLPSYTVKKLEGFTCREILSYVASICGGNALITRDGKFTIIYPTDVNRDIGEGVFDLKRDEVKYKVGKVTCQIKEKETIFKGSLGTDSMELQFENPCITDSILTDIYNRLNGFNYLGYTMKWQGDLSLDIGDIITYTDAKGVTRKLPILFRKLSYNGGLDSELSAKGETKNSNSFNSSGSMKNKVDRMVTEVAVINEAFINYAKINDADITNLKVETAKIQNLEAETANINTLLAGNIGSGSVQTIHLTGKNVVIDNAVIKDAMIEAVNAAKINTGTLDTNKVTVQGPSGNLLIKDNTIQIKDSNRTRVQIGKDASNDYNMYVWDATGKLMFDATGLKADGIKSKIIRDDMVSDTANINGSKINISSLITEVNKDSTQTLKASKIAFDSTGQSLEVSFNSLKSNVDNIEIGGRNYIKNSNFNDGLNNWKYTTGVSAIDGKATLISDSTTCNLYVRQLRIPITEKNTEYTLSFEVTVNDMIWGTDGRVYIHVYARAENGTTLVKSLLGDGILTTSGKYSFTFTTPNEDFYFLEPLLGLSNGSGTVTFDNVKLEKGNKATDWTPAPEDTEEKIQANTTSITAVQGQVSILISDNTINKGDITTLKNNYTSIKATTDSLSTTVASHTSSIGALNTNVSTMQTSITQLNNQIALKVEQTDIDTAVTVVDKKIIATNTKVTSIEANLNGITQRVTSTEGNVTSLTTRMTNVEQDLTGYKVTVGNTYLSKGDAVSTYATKSSMELTATQLKLDFSSSGGYNRIKNGCFLNGSNYWNNWGSASSIVVSDSSNGYGKKLSFKTTGTNQGIEQAIAGLEVGKTYTLSAYVCSVSGQGGIQVNNNSNYLANYTTGNGKWEWLVRTFTAESTSVIIQLGRGAGGINGEYYYAAVQLQEGNVNTAWSPHPSEIYAGYTTIDAGGITVYNGALTVKNNANTAVIKADSNGNLTVRGVFEQYASNGVKSVEIKDNKVDLFDWSRDGDLVGGLASIRGDASGRGINMVYADKGNPLWLGYCNLNRDTYYRVISIDDVKVDNSGQSIIGIYESASMMNYKNITYYGNDNTIALSRITLSNNNDLCLLGRQSRNNVYIGEMDASNVDTLRYFTRVNSSGLHVYGNITCSGTKTRLVPTKNYDGVKLNALETPEPVFEDIGEGKIGEDGLCYIFLDTIMQETINSKCSYQVFLQSYGDGSIFVLDRTENYFIIKGTPKLNFGWRFVAKQKGYETDRLEREVIEMEEGFMKAEEEKGPIEELADKYLKDYEKELIESGEY